MEEVRIIAKRVSFDTFQLGKSFLKLLQHLLAFTLDISESDFIIWTQENVSFDQNFRIVPSPSADQCISQWIGRLEMNGSRESEGRKRVFRGFTVDGLYRSL